MVSQGVKNPLLDLMALEDKSLDEVGVKTETKQVKSTLVILIKRTANSHY